MGRQRNSVAEDAGPPGAGALVGAGQGRPPHQAGGSAGAPGEPGAGSGAGATGAAGTPAPEAATAGVTSTGDATGGDASDASAGDVLGTYLRRQATEFLRSLRVHGESAGSAEAVAEATAAVRQLRRSARRLGGALHTYRPLVDTGWADQLRAELSWLSGTLAREYGYAARLDRLLGALHRLASDGGTVTTGGAGGPAGGGSALPVGAARAGALLERQLTLSRTRAHSAALQALGSSRFHAVADAVAVLASETPLAPEADARPVAEALVPLAEQARRRLAEAVDVLPLARAEHPYNAEALARSLAVEVQGDAAWHQVRLLLRLHRYAREVLRTGAWLDIQAPGADGMGSREIEYRLGPASRALDRHRDAAEAAAAAAAAARTPRIAPATAYALGVLHADQRHEVEAARFAFGRLWTARGSERAGQVNDGRG
ncbi:CHAD domain-containing protein [Streptomyces sp. N2-109]|uniref:CHAD domain-containing protein n=1 Tax=Streptomyces gossypii TaxID=2883101 RepID=A0ABT2JY43_9ACTN|nr:CHAD domain-containing protein [Streptomyces gossypii]MCT2592814.1 CHAD domain-containing protein [Streptomyces gossypii]